MRQVKSWEDSRFGHPVLHFSWLHEERVEDGYVIGKHRDLKLVLILRRRWEEGGGWEEEEGGWEEEGGGWEEEGRGWEGRREGKRGGKGMREK